MSYEITIRGPTSYLLDNQYGPIAESSSLDEALEQARISGITEITLIEGDSRTTIAIT